jgi:lysophospholipase L1-like esterase
MSEPPAGDRLSGAGRRVRHLAAFVAILGLQFALFEAGLRMWGNSEAAPSFQGLFENDPVIGYRLKPNARVRFKTADFDSQININAAGVRDDDEIGRKAPGERRILLLGDSLVLSVQVEFEQTFGELLEAALNRRSTGVRYRVINAGVQGYGPVEEMLFFRRIGRVVEPDLVMTVVFVGNDAEEAYNSRPKLDPNSRTAAATISDSVVTRVRRLVRRSMVLQTIRLRIVTVTARFRNLTPPEPPIQSYAAHPAPRIADGIAITRRAIEEITVESSTLGAGSAIVLMPARFQVDDDDYGRLRDIVAGAGGELVRDGATVRFDRALAPVPVPRFDVLPALRRALPGPDLFFRTTVHLTPHGHRVVADALADFIESRHLLAPPKATVH